VFVEYSVDMDEHVVDELSDTLMLDRELDIVVIEVSDYTE
jgi:hypothetical protein